jgi:nucleoside phosphorylase
MAAQGIGHKTRAGGARRQADGRVGGRHESHAAQVDIGILTTNEDAFRAVLSALPMKAGGGLHKGKHREYSVRHADAGNGEAYTVAVLRQIEQGNGEAQDAARDLIDDLAPELVIIVGIAGGLPSDDLTLGDVVIATRIHDFTLEARKAGEEASYSVTGGPIDKTLASAVANLAAREDELGDWVAGLPARPPVTWQTVGRLYGPAEWQRELCEKLEHHYGQGSAPRAPRYIAGPIASSDRLVNDPALLFPWVAAARNLLAIEMESGGVYHAVRDRCPMLAIRGISDLVGLKRSDAWAKFACAAAAALTRAFLQTGPVPVGVGHSLAVVESVAANVDTPHAAPIGTGKTVAALQSTPGEDVLTNQQPDAAPTTQPGAALTSRPGAERLVTPRYDLFLAHPSGSQASARALYELLQPDVRVFVDERSIAPRARLDQAIPDAQRSSRASVILISSEADAAWYLDDEIVTAIRLHRAAPEAHLLVPVLLDDSASLPYGLRHVQTIDAAASGGLAGVAARLRQLAARLRKEAASVPASPGVSGGSDCGYDHLRLHDRMSRITDDTIFEEILLYARIDRSRIAPRTAKLAERILSVAQLAALDRELCRRIAAQLDQRAPWTR